VFDFYHAAISHASAMLAGYMRKRVGSRAPSTTLQDPFQRVIVGDYGHAIGGTRMTEGGWKEQYEARESGQFGNDADESMRSHLWRRKPEVEAILGEAGRDAVGHPNIFPNLWITSTQLCLRLPKGPAKTELWWFTLMPTAFTDEEREARVQQSNHTFGAAGFLEQEDGENWDQSTRSMKGVIAKKYPLNFSMHVGLGEVKKGPEGVPYIDGNVTEHPQLWTYRAWADWMDAESWDALRKSHTPAPEAGEYL
jgi:hypothetical protein